MRRVAALSPIASLVLLACSQARPVDSGSYPALGDETGETGETGDTAPDTGGSTLAPSSVVINELLAVDGAGGPDWIELTNRGQQRADLTGWTLEDDGGEPWPFPEGTQLRPGAYLLVYADDEDGEESDGLHASFKLASDGERLTLASPDADEGSTVRYPELGEDEAYARITDGADTWTIAPGGGSPAAPNAQ